MATKKVRFVEHVGYDAAHVFVYKDDGKMESVNCEMRDLENLAITGSGQPVHPVKPDKYRWVRSCSVPAYDVGVLVADDCVILDTGDALISTGKDKDIDGCFIYLDKVKYNPQKVSPTTLSTIQEVPPTVNSIVVSVKTK